MPHRKLTYPQQRIVLSKLIMEMIRTSYIYRTDGTWGRHTDEILVAWALAQGTAKGRWYGAEAIAKMVDVPKTTVHRRIEALIAIGFARKGPKGRGYKLSIDELNSEPYVKALLHICDMIMEAAEHLSKMER